MRSGSHSLYQIQAVSAAASERAYVYLLVPARRCRDERARERRLGAAGVHRARRRLLHRVARSRDSRPGNLLGGPSSRAPPEPSGSISYAQMLEEAVSRCKGEPLRSHGSSLDVNLPLERVPARGTTCPTCSSASCCTNASQAAQSPPDLDELRAELIDRFGDAPREVDNLCELMLLKMDLRELSLRALDAGPGRLVVTLGQDAQLDGHKLAALVQKSRGRFSSPRAQAHREDRRAPRRRGSHRTGERAAISLLKCSVQR